MLPTRHLFECVYSILFQSALSLLRQEYKEDTTLKDALELSIKVFHQSLDMTALTSDKGMYRNLRLILVYLCYLDVSIQRQFGIYYQNLQNWLMNLTKLALWEAGSVIKHIV